MRQVPLAGGNALRSPHRLVVFDVDAPASAPIAAIIPLAPDPGDGHALQ